MLILCEEDYMKRKFLIVTSLIVTLFLYGCKSSAEKVKDQFEDYGYRMVLVTNQYPEQVSEYDEIKNIYEIYNNLHVKVATILEFTSVSAMDAAFLEQSESIDEILINDNLVLVPHINNPERIIFIFNGLNPNHLT